MTRTAPWPLASLTVLLAAAGCNKDDPCAKYDNGICEKQKDCEVFVATELGQSSGNWCHLPATVTGEQVCMTSPGTDCDRGTKYASPPDADGNASDQCFSYTTCEAPQGWVDCDPSVGLTLMECSSE